MLLGILSDTHGRLDATIAGLALLKQAGATRIVHCGDVGSEPIIDQLAGLNVSLVWGNNDYERRGLTSYAQRLGVDVLGDSGALEIDSKRIFVTHGDDARLVAATLGQQSYDYLLLGHSHAREDRLVGRTRVINPGALYRTKEKSVAVLDVAADSVRFLML